jgi:alpha-1,3-rhamnosyltransferase
MDPLVSIVVITYNSSQYVLETLESAKEQTYKNIELIVSDDGSTDDTPNICHKWITENSCHFKRVQFVRSEVNTGTPANCNRGIKASLGEWIKVIAGDDLLDRNLLLTQINHLRCRDDIKILWTNVATFHDTETERVFKIQEGTSDLRINKDDVTCQQQFEIMLRQNPVFMGGLIIQRKLLQEIGPFDESFPSFEDLPFLHKVLINNKKLFYLDIIGAYYRKHGASVQVKDINKLRSAYHTDVYRYEMTILKYYRNPLERFLRYLDAGYNLFFTRYISNKKNRINKVLLYGPSTLLRLVINSISNRHNFI